MHIKDVKTIAGYDSEDHTVIKTEEWIFPLQIHVSGEEGAAVSPEVCDSIRQHKTVTEPEDPDEDANDCSKDDAAKGFASLWAKILAFFKAVDDFFRRIFKFRPPTVQERGQI